jgi:hypothetical protein
MGFNIVNPPNVNVVKPLNRFSCMCLFECFLYSLDFIVKDSSNAYHDA